MNSSPLHMIVLFLFVSSLSHFETNCFFGDTIKLYNAEHELQVIIFSCFSVAGK